jgi:hypothetical protein
LETKKIIETCEVTFDETSPGSTPSVSGTSATIQGGSIFVDEDDESDEDENLILLQQQVVAPLVPTTTSPMIDHPQASTSSIHEENQGESEVPKIIAPLHIQRRHPPQQMIGTLHESVTRSRSNDSNSVAHLNPKIFITHELTNLGSMSCMKN